MRPSYRSTRFLTSSRHSYSPKPTTFSKPYTQKSSQRDSFTLFSSPRPSYSTKITVSKPFTTKKRLETSTRTISSTRTTSSSRIPYTGNSEGTPSAFLSSIGRTRPITSMPRISSTYRPITVSSKSSFSTTLPRTAMQSNMTPQSTLSRTENSRSPPPTRSSFTPNRPRTTRFSSRGSTEYCICEPVDASSTWKPSSEQPATGNALKASLYD